MELGSNRRSFGVILAAVLVAVFLAGLKAVDMVIVARSPEQAVAVVDIDAPQLIMNTLDIYPYDGAHTQSDFIIEKSAGALWAGDHGFFIDFDLDNPPVKQPDELRLVLIGGSGAAGWGAQNNYNMVYHKLERKFNERRPCGPKVWLRVVNLAMGGTHSYQNFIALNRWAHAIDPDIIVSYSGSNDLYVSLSTGLDVYYGYPTLGGYVVLSRHSSSPAWLKVIGKVYPGLVRKTNLSLALRSFSISRYAAESNAHFTARFPKASARAVSLTDEAYLSDTLENITLPQYVHAFQSIRRDFPGVPIMIANQAYMFSMDQPVDPSMDVVMPVPLYFKMYERLRRGAERALAGYGEGEWVFFDAHEYYQRHLAARFKPGDGVHLTDDKTDVFADLIGERAFPVLCKRIERRGAPSADRRDAPVLYRKVAPPAWPATVLVGEGSARRIELDGKSYPVRAGEVGAVDWPIRVKGGTRLAGWAIDETAGREAAEVFVLANGRLIGRAKPAGERPDLASRNPAFAKSGWHIMIPADGTMHGRLGIFALLRDGTASELAYVEGFPFATGLSAGAKSP